jgi:hypothetical protein
VLTAAGRAVGSDLRKKGLSCAESLVLVFVGCCPRLGTVEGFSRGRARIVSLERYGSQISRSPCLKSKEIVKEDSE